MIVLIRGSFYGEKPFSMPDSFDRYNTVPEFAVKDFLPYEVRKREDE